MYRDFGKLFKAGDWLAGLMFLLACMLAYMAGSGLRSSIYLKSPFIPSAIMATVLLAISTGLVLWQKITVGLFGNDIPGVAWVIFVGIIGALVTTRKAVYAANPDMIPKS